MLNRIILQNSCNLWVCGRSDVLLLTVDPQKAFGLFLGFIVGRGLWIPVRQYNNKSFLGVKVGWYTF